MCKYIAYIYLYLLHRHIHTFNKNKFDKKLISKISIIRAAINY